MRRLLPVLAAAAVTASLAAAPVSQQTTQVHPGKGGSPHVRSTWTVDGATISVEYGRPFLKGRSLDTLAPARKVWRTGADEATTLVTDKPLKFGSLGVPAGTYTLYTLPGEGEWQLIINKQTGQWGTSYSEKEDLGRVPAKVERLSAPVEQLTFAIEDTPSGGTLKISWGSTSLVAPFTVG